MPSKIYINFQICLRNGGLQIKRLSHDHSRNGEENHLGSDGQPRDRGRELRVFDVLSPHPTSRPFLPTFLIISGQTGATPVLGEYCFWGLLLVSFYNWGPWGGKWEVAVLRLLSSVASGMRPPPVSAPLPRTEQECASQEGLASKLCQTLIRSHHRQALGLLSEKDIALGTAGTLRNNQG